MSTDLETSQPAKSLSPPAPQLRRARFEDYEELTRQQSSLSFEIQSLDDWRSVWLDNPLWQRLGKDWPIGWVLETATGEIVGSLMNVPSLYRFRGRDLICAAPRAWGVTAAYRGYGLHLIDEYFGQPGVDLFIMTTANAIAAPIIDRLAARIPLGDWDAASYWVTGYVEYAQQSLKVRHVPLPGLLAYPAGAALWVRGMIRSKPLQRSPHGVFIETVDRFDSRFDAFWDELVRQNPDKLLAERSSQALSWHFGIPMRRGQLWIFTASRNGRLRAYCILNRKRGGDQVLLVDYQTIDPGLDLLPGLLQAALWRCAKEHTLMLSNFGRGVPKMRAFDECAPYHGESENWKFFYHATNPSLDAELRAGRFWDPSQYDGDASFE